MALGRINVGGGSNKKSVVLPDNTIAIAYSYDNKLVVNWEAPLGGEVPISSYNIYWAKDTGVVPSSLKDFSNKATVSSSTTSYTISGLTNGDTYYVVVESVSEEGYENASLRNIGIQNVGIPYFVFYGSYTNGSITSRKLLYTNDGAEINLFAVYSTGEYSSSYGAYYDEIYDILFGNNMFMAFGKRHSNYADNPCALQIKRYSNYGESTETIIVSGANNTSNAGHASYGNGKVVFGTDADNNVYYLADGSSTPIKCLTVGYPSILNAVFAGGKFFLWAYDASSTSYIDVFISDDGINWTMISNKNANIIPNRNLNICYINGMYVSFNAYSYDGITWYDHSSSTTLSSSGFTGVLFAGDRVYKWASNASYTGVIYYRYTTNGLTWSDEVSMTADSGYITPLLYKNGIFIWAGNANKYGYSTSFDSTKIVWSTNNTDNSSVASSHTLCAINTEPL